jgi:hypothetical protein
VVVTLVVPLCSLVELSPPVDRYRRAHPTTRIMIVATGSGEGDAWGDGGARPDDPLLPPIKFVRACWGHFDEDLAELEEEAAAAASAKEAQRPAEITELVLMGPSLGGMSEEQELRASEPANVLLLRRSFGRLVELLAERPTRLTIRAFAIVEGIGSRDLDRFADDEDVDRLFRDVLPDHPTIDRIDVSACKVPARCVRHLARSVPSKRATPLWELALDLEDLGDDEGDSRGTVSSSSCVQDMCDVLRRDVPLRALSLVSVLEPSECRRILQSLTTNTHLEDLAIRPRTISADALCLDAAASISALRSLRIRGDLTSEGASSLARQLRTNTSLVELHVCTTSGYRELVQEMQRVLKTYNFTLRTFQLTRPCPPRSFPFPGSDPATLVRRSTIPAALIRNERIGRCLHNLGGCCSATPTALGPLMLDVVSDVPTVLYRFLRWGDINALVEHLRSKRDAAPRRSRWRRRWPVFRAT